MRHMRVLNGAFWILLSFRHVVLDLCTGKYVLVCVDTCTVFSKALDTHTGTKYAVVNRVDH